MKENLISNLFGIILILTICSSCSKGVENDLIGEWNLKFIETSCVQDSLIEKVETFQSNGFCCINLSTTEISDTTEITYSSISCRKLIFKNDSEVDLVKDENGTIDTLNFSYKTFENEIEICTDANQCVDYVLSNNELDVTVPLTTLSGASCERRFIYRK